MANTEYTWPMQALGTKIGVAAALVALALLIGLAISGDTGLLRCGIGFEQPCDPRLLN